jgi:hypothetical protein
MAVLLGGRAAEQLVFGHLSTGAADDLAKVTDIARAMVTRYGMRARDVDRDRARAAGGAAAAARTFGLRRAVSAPTKPRHVVILGAAGRDFHDFNTVYRDDPGTRVVAFTATQIPGIGGRRYPPELAGARYPDGIPIREERELEAICARRRASTRSCSPTPTCRMRMSCISPRARSRSVATSRFSARRERCCARHGR